MITTTIKVGGMSCEHCVKAVETATLALPGVQNAKVDLAAGSVTVEHDEALAPLAAIRAAIEEQGYDV
jgi:copper chaperone